MRRFQAAIEESLRCYNGMNLLDSLDYHVLDDRALLDGAHPSEILDHFAALTITAPRQEQGRGVSPGGPPRYRHCLHVDKAALCSVVGGSAPPASNCNGLANMVALEMGWLGMRPEHTQGREERQDTRRL